MMQQKEQPNSTFWKRSQASLVQFFQIPRKRLLINLAILLAIYTLIILTDRLTKDLLFRWNAAHDNGDGVTFLENRFFGVRSVGNYGAMLGLWRHQTALIQTIALSVTMITFGFGLFARNFWIVPALAFLGAGSFGNALDRFAFDGLVKDIFFTPWINHGHSGTFNCADLAIGCGAMLFFSVSFYQLIRSWRKPQKPAK